MPHPSAGRKALCPIEVGNYPKRGKKLKDKCVLQIIPIFLLPGAPVYSGLWHILQSPLDTSKTNIYIIPFAQKRKLFSALLWNPLQDWPQGEKVGEGTQ